MGRHFQQGTALFDLRRYRDAVDAFTAELAADPDSAIALAMRSASWINLGNIRKAEADVQESLRKDPNLAYAHYILSFARAKRGRTAAAESSIREALRLLPCADYFSRLADICHSQGRFHESLKFVDEALVYEPLHTTAQIIRANALSAMGRQKDAQDCLLGLLRQNPDASEAHHALGALTLNTGKTSEAIGLLREARRLSPAVHNDRNALGAAYGRLFAPLRFVDPYVMRLHSWSPAHRWLLLASLGTLLMIVSYVFSHSPVVTVPIFLVAFNAVAASVTFDIFATAVGKIAYRRDLDIVWYRLLPESVRIVFPVLFHAFFSLVAVVCACIPGIAIFFLGFVPNFELVLVLIRERSLVEKVGHGMFAFFAIALPITLGAIFLIDSASPAAALACWCISLIPSYVLSVYR